MRRQLIIWWMAAAVALPAGVAAQSGSAAWRAGTARADITPDESVWMAGYAARTEPGEGTLHPLWVKALALEAASGNLAVLVTSDLLGLPAVVSSRVAARIERAHGIARDRLMLTSSHTHSGPVISRALQDVYPLDEEGWSRIDRYTAFLEDRIVDVVGDALERLAPARLSAGQGVTRFAVNRRNNVASGILTATELEGPIDHSVPVISVRTASGDLLAVAFGYACHATVLDGQEWSGDYPGYAQIALEEAYPGVTALFFAGAGADQNPLPRRTVAIAEQYGEELAAAVSRALVDNMRPLRSTVETSYSEVAIRLSAPPSREALEEAAEETSGYRRRWAARMLQESTFPESYPYPIQMWHLGDQALVALGGEVVVDYAISLKRLLGPDTFVIAYANDVMGYIPSTRVLREGGYEGATSQIVYGHHGTWRADIETTIISEVLRHAEELGVALPESPIE